MGAQRAALCEMGHQRAHAADGAVEMVLEGREEGRENGVGGEAVAGEQGERAQQRGQAGREVESVGAQMGRYGRLGHVFLYDILR